MGRTDELTVLWYSLGLAPPASWIESSHRGVAGGLRSKCNPAILSQ